MFITFEGIEGCGKSTQVQLLAERLGKIGKNPLVLREPGGTPIGEQIRDIFKHPDNHAMRSQTELLLVCASRAQLVREVIKPALADGRVVLCDRFLDSTIAYQGYGRGLDLNTVNEIIEFAVGEAKPDVTIFLSVPVPLSRERIASKKKDRVETSDTGFFLRTDLGFHNLAKENPDRIIKVDGSLSITTVEELVWQIVGPLFR